MNYICVWCGESKCPHSEYWAVPEEDKEEWNKYQADLENYHKIHNPKIFEFFSLVNLRENMIKEK